MRVGIVGGGQLARMLALAGIPLGLHFVFLDPAKDACAAELGEHLCGDYDDERLLAQMAERCDVVTYEFENVPETSIEFLSARVPVFPDARALATARDRLNEKSLFRELDIDTVPFVPVDSLSTLQQAVTTTGLPAVLKTRTMGYDGKGQAVLREETDIEKAWRELGGVPLILEGFAEFHREVSIIAVRGRDGEERFYPLAENIHRDGILHISRSRPGDALEKQAQEYAKRLLEKLDYVGVMALELFDTGDELLANEMAPRVHNSGHWTIEGCVCSQFENHMRAVVGLPLGATDATGAAAMVNFIGEIPPAEQLLALPGVHLHDYSKAAKPGRKVGHVTIVSKDDSEATIPDALLR
ncbi:MAG: 5-(carboxyamino)imidazole ribonucleotide synthase [Gammaproteobacteria bacterium]|nr:5-(carboxyamino)imidazole ribonucleotide synthase [Gammaproteobacteria bacterium]